MLIIGCDYHPGFRHDHSIVSCDQLLAAHGTCICAKRQPMESPLIGLNSEFVLTSVPVLSFCPGLGHFWVACGASCPPSFLLFPPTPAPGS